MLKVPYSDLLSKFGVSPRDEPISYTRAPSDEYDEKPTSPAELRQNPWKLRLALLFFGLLATSISLNLYTFSQLRRTLNLDRLCSTYTSQHRSPVSEEIEIKYQTVTFNGSFSKESIYRQPPSPEVDKAWDDLGANFELIRIPEDRADDFGIPRGQAKIPERLGGGYPVIVETFHHLHCVNLLRKSTWFNYNYYRELGEDSFINDESILRKHVGHCMDILRQQIMCTADYNIFGQWWIEGKGTFVDFNTKHTCKNFEDIRKWTRSRLLPKRVEVEKRPGDVVLPDVP